MDAKLTVKHDGEPDETRSLGKGKLEVIQLGELTVGHEDHHVAESTLALVLNALGDSLLGASIAEALSLPRDTARDLAADRLRQRLEIDHPRAG